jgi:putative ABC transport system permease protein
MNPDEAREAAATAGWGDRVRDVMARDGKTARRALVRSKGYAIAVVATLALGIGAAVTIFSVVDRVLIRPLVYPDSHQIVALYQQSQATNIRLASYPTLQDWGRANTGLSALAWIRGDGLMLEREGGPERVTAGFVSPGFFKVMGQRAALGRTFLADEEAGGGDAEVVVLSHNLWQTTFGGDPDIIGKALRLGGMSVEVVGVMPPGFAYPSWAMTWRPLASLAGRDPVIDRRDFHADSRAVGRLAPGVTAEEAARRLGVVQQQLAIAYPKDEGDFVRVQVTPLQEEMVGPVRTTILALGAAVGLILLVACVNVANLAAVRGSARGREVAIRFALGASRAQVTRQLMIESATLGVVGGVIGTVLASRAVAWLRVTAPFNLPRAQELAIDGRAVAVAAAITILTAVVFGVLPALHAALRAGGLAVLLGGRSGAGGTRREARSRAVLTSLQFALALVLLVGAGLLAQSYRRVLAARIGFDPQGLLATAISPPNAIQRDAQLSFALYQRIIDRLRSEPGVEEAAIVNFLALGGAGVPTRVEVPGRTSQSDDQATYITVSDGYQRALGMPIVRGRWFTEDEIRSPGAGIVVSDVVARRYWPGQDPIGKPLTIYRSSQSRPDFGRAVPSVVVGVVGDVRQYGVESRPEPAVYVPLAAEPWPWVSIVVRARDASVTPDALRRAVVDVEPNLLPMGPGPSATFRFLDQSLTASLAPRRYVLGIVGLFSGCAFVLAVIGLYGVASYVVTRRTHEFGIRIALGASAQQVVQSVLRWGMALAIIGCAVGLAAALGLVRFIESMLYETRSTDLTVLATVPLLLIVVGAIAVYVPARRAARVDPIVALRGD